MRTGDRLVIRWRWSTLSLLIATALVGVEAGAVAVWPHTWPWLITIMVITASSAPVMISVLNTAQQRRVNTARVARGALQGTTGPGGEVLPLVCDSWELLEARVHQAVVPISYIHRDIEEKLIGYLQLGRPVLLVGSSMVGKTKMAVTLIQQRFSTRSIVIPDSKEALASLDASDLVLQRAVIFLDDINRLISPDGITDGTLRRLSTAGNIIIGTIRATEYSEYHPTDELRPPEWDVITVFERAFISRSLSPAEQDRLCRAVDDPVIRDRIRQTGLGEYVGAAEQIAEALTLSESVSPLGHAIILGAADWQRAGASEPVPGSLLSSLAAPHLDSSRLVSLHDENTFSKALSWVTREVNPMVSLLSREGADTFRVFDYALDLISSKSEPIPAATWTILVENASSNDLASIGYTAHIRYRRPEVAKAAWRRAIDIEDPKVKDIAAVNLGILLAEQGDLEGARAAFQLAIDSGDKAQAARAARSLGVLLAHQGDVEGARAAFQLAIDSGDKAQAARAARGLGVLLSQQGDAEGARRAFIEVMESEDQEQSAKAAINLGDLISGQPETPLTLGTYQIANHASWRHHAAWAIKTARFRIRLPGHRAASGSSEKYEPVGPQTSTNPTVIVPPVTSSPWASRICFRHR